MVRYSLRRQRDEAFKVKMAKAFCVYPEVAILLELLDVPLLCWQCRTLGIVLPPVPKNGGSPGRNKMRAWMNNPHTPHLLDWTGKGMPLICQAPQ